eukprot:TRINITY_DN4146_c0_g1_i1.p1 TRINITY_DN4146_c0_g1~~TRINITY_DN4146_c0_g1_i1.p1  ORF type:complete len:607 (+),score=120.06 TRINITY_DN4146_c0_g1_i1:86-1822(+)
MECLKRVVSQNGRVQGKELQNVYLLLVVGFFSLLLVVGTALSPLPMCPLRVVAMGIVTAVGFTPPLMCVCGIHFSTRRVQAYMVLGGFAIIITDLEMRATSGPPQWPAFVLLADLSLVLGLSGRFASSLIAAAELWVFVSCVESTMRFGLYDLPGSQPTSDRWEALQDTVSCSQPPCATDTANAFRNMTMSALVMTVDFIATRRFSDSAEKGKAAMAYTIETVEAIAKLLAGYDIDTVAEMLHKAEGRLPPAMHDALFCLQANLRMYRPYLPKSCLPYDEDEAVTVISSISSDSPVSGPDIIKVTPVLAEQLGPPQLRKVTLMVAHFHDMTECLEGNAPSFAEWVACRLGSLLQAVETSRGLVDLFSGDRVFASFNASRMCAVHATYAASAAKDALHSLREGINIGLASGHAWCGDVGCQQMRRFDILGRVPAVAQGMERAGRVMGFDILCDTAVHREAAYRHLSLLLPRPLHLVCAVPDPPGVTATAVPGEWTNDLHRVYEVAKLDGCESSKGNSGPNEEWMYEIGHASARWDGFNRLAGRYLSKEEGVEKAAGLHGEKLREYISRSGGRHPLLVVV